jgi:hypothetical protein
VCPGLLRNQVSCEDALIMGDSEVFIPDAMSEGSKCCGGESKLTNWKEAGRALAMEAC